MIYRKNIFIIFTAVIVLGGLSFAPARAANLEVNFSPDAFTAPAQLKTAAISDRSYLPLDWQTISPVYNYFIDSAGFYDPSRPMTIKLSYDQASNDKKSVFAFDWASRRWLPLTTLDNTAERYVTVSTKSTMDRLVLMSQPGVMASGQASWYKYKNGLFAASPDYTKGSTLRVHNIANGKYVDVTVNDYGPDRAVHPERVIDLDRVAFSRIASPSEGVISVRVEPLKATLISKPASNKPVDKLPTSLVVPTVTASSAVLVRESDGQVLWGKNEKQAAPLASLTKLVAAKVFLDTVPDLEKVVAYQYQDEAYNYEHVKPYESARLRVEEGETMKVKDFLYSALVGSANNAVESLVRVSGLSRDNFIARMNSVVKSWGANDTKFIEPSGLAPQNVSSPFDYAIIAKEVLSDPLLAKISTTATYNFTTINTEKSHRLTNTNQLLKNNTYSISGSKTGYLDEAGYCLMTRVATPQGNLIVVNFGSPSKAASFSDNETLIKYGQALIKK